MILGRSKKIVCVCMRLNIQTKLIEINRDPAVTQIL